MKVILMRLSENAADAPKHMAAHNEWIAKGFDDGVFLLIGSLQSAKGGMILAAGEDNDALQKRIAVDPFVREGIVEVELHDAKPFKFDPRLSFILEKAA